MADALASVGEPVIHVSKVPGFEGDVAGQSPADDETIAKWCAATGRVLVTCDEDFRGRWVRSGLLERHGVEVIVFDEELAGLRAQHREITRHLPHWQQELGLHQPGHRVWLQSRHRNAPRQRR